MNTTATPLSDPTTPAAPLAADAHDWARVVMEQQLAVLGELAEAGLDVARAIQRLTTDAERPVSAGEMALAYARASRAVRLTLALQSKAIAELRALLDGRVEAAAAAEEEREQTRFELETCRKARIELIVERIAEAEHEGDEDEANRLAVEAGERLEDLDRYDDLLTRPFSETVAILCRDIGLKPDWNRLAEEAWARAEIDSGAPGEPLAALGLAPRPPRPGAPPRLSPEALDARMRTNSRFEDELELQRQEQARAPPGPIRSPWGSVAAERQALAGAKRVLGLTSPA